MSKKLQKGSQYEQFDLDGDGIVSDEELSRSEHMIRLENSDKMQDQQRMLCWVSSISSISNCTVPICLKTPNAPVKAIRTIVAATALSFPERSPKIIAISVMD